ncbi:MAG: multidrug efflux SMR transporter [Rhodobacteraceae bacterium]|nr:multidrug efflux SMR transporter [Paracoccaceae bacterium]
MSAWVFLAMSITFEILGTFFLKLSDGFAQWHWGMLAMGLYIGSFVAFAPALRTIPVGVAYALWAGCGIAAAALIGLFAFGQQLDAWQMLFILMILVGAIGLRLGTKE